jgi:hypothetical protein
MTNCPNCKGSTYLEDNGFTSYGNITNSNYDTYSNTCIHCGIRIYFEYHDRPINIRLYKLKPRLKPIPLSTEDLDLL